MEEMIGVKCSIVRGGKQGIFIMENELPKDARKAGTKYILEIFGSPDVRQINNGLGGADVP